MFNLNLLPPKEKEFLKIKEREFFIITLSIRLCWFLLIIIAFLLFGIFFLKTNLSSLSKQITIQKKFLESKKEYKELENKAKKFNEFVIFLDKIQKDRLDYSKILLQLTEQMPSQVKLNSFSLDKQGQIFLRGNARERSDFLRFKENLEKSNLYKKIDSPLSNIVQKDNINFELSLILK